jgi:hypothetical protein
VTESAETMKTAGKATEPAKRKLSAQALANIREGVRKRWAAKRAAEKKAASAKKTAPSKTAGEARKVAPKKAVKKAAATMAKTAETVQETAQA